MNVSEILDQIRGLDGRKVEDEIYRIVWDEIETGNLDPVAKARSLADGLTDDNSLRSQYIRHRVRRLKDEIESENALRTAQLKEKQIIESAKVLASAKSETLRMSKERAKRRNERMDRIGNVVYSGFASFLVATAVSILSGFVFISILEVSDGVFAGLLLLVWLVLLPLTWYNLYILISGTK